MTKAKTTTGAGLGISKTCSTESGEENLRGSNLARRSRFISWSASVRFGLETYRGAVEYREAGFWSLIVANAKRFEVTDLDFSNQTQVQLESIPKRNGAITYSYFFPALAQSAPTPAGDGHL